MTEKHHTNSDLVKERETECQVHVEVHDPPRLILNAAANDARRADPGHYQETKAKGGVENVGIVHEKCPELAHEADAGQLGVAPGDEQHVQGNEADWPTTDATMPSNELVLTHASLQPRNSRNQD